MLGAASIADSDVMPAISASSNGRLVAIASRDPKRARALASRHSVPLVSPTYEALLREPEVDAVYIPLHHSAHKEWALRAAAAGKHVLCEKPLGMNAAEAEEMGAGAERAGVLLMEAFMYRFHPVPREFVAGLRDPINVSATFGFTLQDPDNFRLRKELGGGALLDVGCYTVSITRWILGEPVEVAASAHFPKGPGGVDMTVRAWLQFASGAMAVVSASFERPEEQEVAVVTKGGWERLDTPFSRMEPNPYQLMVESFARSALGGYAVELPVSDSVANMKVLDRIREAIS